jgi:hypothetical protein
MSELSLAAQAILKAAHKATQNPKWQTNFYASYAAAVLRAAADQVISPVPPPCEDFDEYAQGFLAAHIKYRTELLAIADELEGRTVDEYGYPLKLGDFYAS